MLTCQYPFPVYPGLFWLVILLLSPSWLVASDDSQSPIFSDRSYPDQITALQGSLEAAGELWQGPLQQLYDLSEHSPVWSDGTRFTVQAASALDQLRQAVSYGLQQGHYLLENLERELVAINTGESRTQDVKLIEFDVALSNSLMHFISDIYRGRIDPVKTGFKVVAERKDIDLANAVYALSRAPNFDQALRRFEPRLSAYHRLKKELNRYQALEMAFQQPALRGQGTIHPDESYSDSGALQALLTALGDYQTSTGIAAETYSGTLVDAVKRFQLRHGLEADGIIGHNTFAQLNTPLSRRIEQIQFSLERLRWLPTAENGLHIVVNIPAFELYGFEVKDAVETVVTKMNVIVGSAINKHETPVFVADLEYLVFRPYWNVPRSITVNELLPKLENDPAYLGKHRYEIVQGLDVVSSTEVTGESLAGLRSGHLRIRQRPGESNALGLVKFIFPNSNSVYLHDTPTHQLFSQSRRDFSHGCIRVEDPVHLAEFILGSQDHQWQKEDIVSAINGQDNNNVKLSNHIPVHIFYTTAIVRENGDISFFDDIYGHDQNLRRLLTQHNLAR
jgi:murein L,D-transpeptidase YcbB/YkuD